MKKIRIFKNRGDIYIPQANEKADKEKRILIILLIFIIAFTFIFTGFFALKNDFSIKNFFTPESMLNYEENNEELLPEVDGKTNYLFILSNENTNEMYFSALIQADMSTVSFKACSLDSSTQTESGSFSEIYNQGGAGKLADAVNGLFGIDVDFYIDIDYKDYRAMFNYLGDINYTVLKQVKYKDTSRYGFNIKIKEGENRLNGDNAEKLMRYYGSVEKNYSALNDLILSALAGHCNEGNYEKRETAFSKFIEYSQTDITVKDFAQRDSNLKVLCAETVGINIYNVEVIYDNNKITSDSVENIKGYFSK